MGRETVAIITDMEQPLGYAIGNAIEVKEAIDILNNEGPADLRELCVKFAATMVHLGGGADSLESTAAAFLCKKVEILLFSSDATLGAVVYFTPLML